jgi:hypothetical protein
MDRLEDSPLAVFVLASAHWYRGRSPRRKNPESEFMGGQKKQRARPLWSRSYGFTNARLRRAVSVVVVDMMTTMVMCTGKCGGSSRYQHHSKKGEGDLLHDASFISRALEG